MKSRNGRSLRMALMGRAMLTVSDFQGFADAGGMNRIHARLKNKIGVKIDTRRRDGGSSSGPGTAC